jgi:hypothetical protein
MNLEMGGTTLEAVKFQNMCVTGLAKISPEVGHLAVAASIDRVGGSPQRIND